MKKDNSIIYTITDEAPALATISLLKIIEFFLKKIDVSIEKKDISLSSRILSVFKENLDEKQKKENDLFELGKLVKKAKTNIIKLPNISASIPQLNEAIKELKSKGYNIPYYPSQPKNESEKQIKEKYFKILGSAVNPILREGNSDRRIAESVKKNAKEHPHEMGEWERTSKTHIASMKKGDFYENEESKINLKETEVVIELIGEDGIKKVLKEKTTILKEEIVDVSFMSKKALNDFFVKEFKDAKEKKVLLSLHLKATMMKISDPIIFGEAIEVYYKNLFKKNKEVFQKLKIKSSEGIASLLLKIKKLEKKEQEEIKKEIEQVYKERPALAMVNSEKKITNLHTPSDIIIDASMPAVIRNSGKMWGENGEKYDTKALIPDRSYSGTYKEVIDFCKKNGAFDVTTMGSVSNIGLMAQKAEEYGSHDKTFLIEKKGSVLVTEENGNILFKQNVEKGDIWRMCQTKDLPIKNWIKLAVNRAKQTKTPIIFWLDEKRAHDKNIIKKVKNYLLEHNTKGLEIKILEPSEAMKYTLERVKNKKDTISVTGNILRDYLTDLFPILELGTSAKMLSIVPLLSGGSLFETGAGGSAPKHVEQFIKEGHLRWDSMGEFLALAASLEDLAIKNKNEKVQVFASALETANKKVLMKDKKPSRKVNELDTRGSHFYLTLYWAEALAKQTDNTEIKKIFLPIFNSILSKKEAILKELTSAQGKPVDLGGYYQFDENKVKKAMRPSKTFNAILEKE